MHWAFQKGPHSAGTKVSSSEMLKDCYSADTMAHQMAELSAVAKVEKKEQLLVGCLAHWKGQR